MTQETFIPVLHVKQNNDIELYKAKLKEDKVYLKNEKVAQFTNAGVFTVIDKTGKKKRRFKTLIYLDGKANCSEIKTKQEIIEAAKTEMDPLAEQNNPGVTVKVENQLERLIGNAYSIFEPLTDQDRKTIVKREVAKQLGRFKPIETWQFLLIMITLGVSIAINFIPGI